MHVETNESVSASHLTKQNPIYSNTSQSALGMNMNSVQLSRQMILKLTVLLFHLHFAIFLHI